LEDTVTLFWECQPRLFYFAGFSQFSEDILDMDIYIYMVGFLKWGYPKFMLYNGQSQSKMDDLVDIPKICPPGYLRASRARTNDLEHFRKVVGKIMFNRLNPQHPCWDSNKKMNLSEFQ
jgi:hypothetical protein